MKKYLLLLVLLVPLPTFSASISELDPISHWNFDEVSGVRYDSVLTSGNDLTDINSVTSALGLLDLSADFETSNNQYLTKASPTDMAQGVGNFSVSFWQNRESDTDSGYNFALSSDNPYSKRFSVSILDTLFYAQMYDGTNGAVIETTISSNIGDWIHIVVTRTGGVLEGFVNAVSIGTGENTYGTSASTNLTPYTKLNIGAYVSNNNQFDGLIDHITYFDYALSQEQINFLYGSGVPPSFEQSTTSTSQDYAIIYNDSMPVGTTTCVQGASGTICVNEFVFGSESFVCGFRVFFIVFYGIFFYFNFLNFFLP